MESATETANGALLVLILSMAWTCLNDTPNNQKNLLFNEFIPTESDLKEIASSITLYFPDNLHETLLDETPPTVNFFHTLPEEQFKGWAIYLLILAKPGHRCRIYIGSGTDSRAGFPVRWYTYDYGYPLPRYVAASMAIGEDYTIVHKGLLCWTLSIPAPALQPMVRLYFILLEATFAYTFWTMYSREKDYGMRHMCLWDRRELEYTGLCGHCALYEGIKGDFGLSAEKLEELAAERKAITAAKSAIRSTDWHYKQMVENRDEYLDAMAERNRKYRDSNPERYKSDERNRKAAHKANDTYYCDLCKISCHTKSDLDEHYASEKHVRKATGVDSGSSRFNCSPCAYSTHKISSWNDHCRSNRHRRNVPDQTASNVQAILRFKCDPCGFATDKSSTWTNHCRSHRHRQNVPTQATSDVQLASSNRVTKKSTGLKRFNCGPCAHSTNKKSDWDDHCRSWRHQRKVSGATPSTKPSQVKSFQEEKSGGRDMISL